MVLTPGIYGDYNFTLGNSNIVVGNKNIFSGERNIADYSDENLVSGENNLVENSFNNILNSVLIKLQNSNKNQIFGNNVNILDSFGNYIYFSGVEDPDYSFTLKSLNSFLNIEDKSSSFGLFDCIPEFENSFINLIFNYSSGDIFSSFKFKNCIINGEITKYNSLNYWDIIDENLLYSEFPFILNIELIKELFGSQVGEFFGSSVVVDDNYIYIGSPEAKNADGDYVGKITIFNKTDYSVMNTIFGDIEDIEFAFSLATDEDYVYIGAPFKIVDDKESVGVVYRMNKYDYSFSIILSGAQERELFGYSLYVDENYLYVGSSGFDSNGLSSNGKLTIFNKSDYSVVKELFGTTNEESFGSSIWNDDEFLYVGSISYENNKGKITLFDKNFRIFKELIGEEDDEDFGSSVCSDDNFIFIGSDYEDTMKPSTAKGKISIFSKIDFNKIKELYGTQELEGFGKSIFIKDNNIFIGSDYYSVSDVDNESSEGKVTIFKIS